MNIIVTAPRGKMGHFITKVAEEREGVTVVGAVAPKGRDYIGKDVGEVALLGKSIGVLVVDDLESIIDKCDCIIDFSTKEFSMEVLDLAIAHKKALVLGTTGFSEEEKKKIEDAGKEIPMLYAANTSKLVNVMNKVLEMVTKAVGEEMDIEILEYHDQLKKDAPSGTSKEMGELIAHTMGKDIKDLAVYGREGHSPREKGSIGYHSIRSGNISSSHTVMFGGIGERLEITHHAYDYECFAIGAVDAALYLKDKGVGNYTIKEVLGL
ncbi:MAG: 4-hydroxy-tetrahydrodipicolinate reductase [Lachnospiraceae bacterium]|nr:4-hydroxy-tetrahydrodipicolinate reductase [Lachnospiraceae bacterium]